ncbi:MAG: Do family serine endopeptidase [Balneolaceae bacterium]
MDNITKLLAILALFLTLFLGVQMATETPDGEPVPETTSSTLQNSAEPKRADDIPIRTLRDFNNAIVDIAERANPTVVTITTTQTVRVRQQSPFGFFFNDPRFDREQEFQRSGLGSGVIVDASQGYIITNNHVIDNADEIRIRMFNGDEYDAEIVGTDPGSDVAVLKVEADNLREIPLGNSDELRVGEMVLAIGSPLNEQFAHTVSQGIVSASGRAQLGLNLFENYIQTDAAINPGNSGGALINLNGELIGINTAIASRSGGSQGIGFAIPVNMVRNVMEALITDGRVSRGFLGIQMGGEVDRTMARALGMSSPRGFVVGEVVNGGPADQAGLRTGDVIVKLNGQDVRDFYDFRVAIANMLPGTEIELEVFRDGELNTYTVELGELETEDVASLDSDREEELIEQLGFEVENLTDNIRQQLRLQEDVDGVVVSTINQTSRAYRQGLRQGDVITQVASERIETSAQFYNAMDSLIQSGRDAVLLRINRQGNNMFVAFEL